MQSIVRLLNLGYLILMQHTRQELYLQTGPFEEYQNDELINLPPQHDNKYTSMYYHNF